MNLFGKSKREQELEKELEEIYNAIERSGFIDLYSLCHHVSDVEEKLEENNSEMAKLRCELDNSIQREKLIQEKLDDCTKSKDYFFKYANFAMYSHLITRIQRDNVVYELERRNADIVLSLERKGTPPEKIERSAKRNATKVLKSINKRPNNWDSVLDEKDKEAYQQWISTTTTTSSLVPVANAFNFLALRENRWKYF